MGWEPLPEGMGALPLVERLKAMNVEILDRLYAANVEIGQSFDAGGHRLTNLAPGTEDTDAATVGQLNSIDLTDYLRVDGGNFMEGTLNMKDESLAYLNGVGGSATLEIDPADGTRFRLRLGGSGSPITVFSVQTSGDAKQFEVGPGGSQFNNALLMSLSANEAIYFRRPDVSGLQWAIGAEHDNSFVIRNSSSTVVTIGGVVNVHNRKITSLATGTASTDAANVGQLSLLEARIKSLEEKVNEK